MDSITNQPNSLIAQQPIDRNPAAVFLAGLPSTHTRRNNRRHLAQIANGLLYGEWETPRRETIGERGLYRATYEAYINAAFVVDWSAIRAVHTSAIRSHLMERYAPGTVNVMLSALRGVLKEAWRLGLMMAEDYHRAIDIENVSSQSLPAGRDLDQLEIAALILVCLNDETPAGLRDAAIIGALYTCGLRRSELVNLTLEHYSPSTGQIRIINGKGRKDRFVYLADGARTAMRDWLKVRGDSPGWLFLPINKAGMTRANHMSAQAIYKMLKKRAAQAKIKSFSPHDFRRTFVGDLLDAGVDIVTVQKLAGHASVETTGRYDRRPERVKRKASEKLRFPYPNKPR